MKRETRKKARQLRKDGNSISDIASQLNVSRGSVSSWCRDIELTEIQKANLQKKRKHWGRQNKGAQVNRQKAQEQRQVYQEEGRLKAQEKRPLHMMGCMLYWAEGGKQKNTLHFVNSDPHMMRMFIRFLREELDVPDSLISLQLHCHTHDDDQQHQMKIYWSQILDLPMTCFQKVQVKKGSDTRKNRLENGICAIRVSRTEYVMHIFGAIQEYGGFDNPDWLF